MKRLVADSASAGERPMPLPVSLRIAVSCSAESLRHLGAWPESRTYSRLTRRRRLADSHEGDVLALRQRD
jgi:hypothetical protein